MSPGHRSHIPRFFCHPSPHILYDRHFPRRRYHQDPGSARFSAKGICTCLRCFCQNCRGCAIPYKGGLAGWETDPLKCGKCGGSMKTVAFIDDFLVIKKILKHLGLWELPQNERPSPRMSAYTEDDCLQKKNPYSDYNFLDVALGRNEKNKGQDRKGFAPAPTESGVFARIFTSSRHLPHTDRQLAGNFRAVHGSHQVDKSCNGIQDQPSCRAIETAAHAVCPPQGESCRQKRPLAGPRFEIVVRAQGEALSLTFWGGEPFLHPSI
jgi:hypothetical protein